MPQSDLNLAHAAAWNALGEGAHDAASPFRYLTLASVADGDKPHARLLVLRRVNEDRRTLEFHTDTRSPKWRELTNNPSVCVLGFDPKQRLQLRLAGEATLYGPECRENEQAWKDLSPWTKMTYCGGPPGDPADAEDTGALDGSPPSHEDVADGRERFGVIMFQAASLDWFQLARGNNRRALFQYADQTGGMTSTWITP